jgi:competence protein ComEA
MVADISGRQIVLGSGVLAVILLGAYWQYRSTPSPASFIPANGPPAAAMPESSPDGTSTTAPPEAKAGLVVVHVVGAVQRPGVYELTADQRVNDALAAAGGALPQADLEALNLAARLSDGQQVRVLRKGEAAAGQPRPQVRRAATARGTSSSTDAAVDLNSATEGELDALPGVGPAIAARILQYRETHGRFQRPEELMEVSGIGPKKFEQLKASVTTN